MSIFRLHPRGSCRAYARLRESANERTRLCVLIQAQAPSVFCFAKSTFLSEGGLKIENEYGQMPYSFLLFFKHTVRGENVLSDLVEELL